MSYFENRSRFVVTVKNSEAHRREFPFTKLSAASKYRNELISKGFGSARVDQLEDQILLRIRTKGHPELTQTFGSYEAAEIFEAQVTTERRQGVFIDYSKSLHTTVADLIRKFIKDELAHRKNQEAAQNYLTFFNAMLEDSEGILEKQIAQRDEEEARLGKGKSSIKIKARRTPMGSLEWLKKPLTDVTAEDIEDWMRSREGDVDLSTIWRQYEHIRGMINLAINTWGYPLRVNPTRGVRRVDFRNERDRRLVDDEFDRIMVAARRFDEARSLELRVQELIAEELAEEVFSSKSQRKHRLVAARKKVTATATDTFRHRPVMEAFILFQLATGARRGESLTLPWAHVNFIKKSALLTETKNGLARRLALRGDLLELLGELPREGELVFGLTVKTCTTAWKAILEDAGITEAAGAEKLTIHDLRHEAISSVAETGVSLVELQAFSGHRDIRMLQRYTHLCMSNLADKLTAAVASGTIKNGRRRWDAKVLKVRDVVHTTSEAPVESPAIPCAPAKTPTPAPASTSRSNVIPLFDRKSA